MHCVVHHVFTLFLLSVSTVRGPKNGRNSQPSTKLTTLHASKPQGDTCRDRQRETERQADRENE